MPRPLVLFACLCLLGLGYLLLGSPGETQLDSQPSDVLLPGENDSDEPSQSMQEPGQAESVADVRLEQSAEPTSEPNTDLAQGALIELVGYPESVEPRLVKQPSPGGPPPTSPPSPISGSRDVAGRWAFADLPAAENWQVVFFRPYPSGQMAAAEGLLPRSFVGPTDREPKVHVRCELSDGPGVTGIFVDHESGDSMQFEADEAARFEVRAHSALGPHKSIKYWIELFPDGRFIAQPLPYAVASHRLAEVRSIQILDLVHNRAAAIELTVRADQTWADLGKVRLGQTPPFLALKIVDANGAALVGAEVQLQAEIRQADVEAHWTSLGNGETKASDTNGYVQYFAPSVDEAFAFGYSASFLEGRQTIQSLKALVSLPGYVPVEREFAAATQQVEVVMQEACTLKWRIRHGRLKDARLHVAAVSVGADPTPSQIIERVDLSRVPKGQEWLNSAFDKLPPGQFDLVVLLGTDSWELMRLSNLVAYTPDHEEAGQLHDLDVDSQIHWFDVRYLDANGTPIDPNTIPAKFRYMTRKIEQAEAVRHCRARGIPVDGLLRFAVPRSATQVSGVLGPSNPDGLWFENLAIGVHDFIFQDN